MHSSQQQSTVLKVLTDLGDRKLDALKNEIIEAVRESSDRDKTTQPLTSSARPSEIYSKLHRLARDGGRVFKKEQILRSLRFSGIEMRQEAIPEAYAKTFEWVFQASATGRHRPQVNFQDWLKTGNGYYWIAGKAGSGKSTLMKFISRDQRTRSLLNDWARHDTYVIASFYFWNAGNAMQKSLQGFLRSLLHQVLFQLSDLIPIVCSSQWNKRDSDTEEDWPASGLKSAFDALIKHVSNRRLPAVKIIFFVDGIDEYDGNHGDIIVFLRNLAASSGIKLCLSSRPWNIFVEAFGENNGWKLMLQDLTKADIKLYVDKNLKENKHFAKLSKVDHRCNGLVDEIVLLASGVFLWINLVVRSLCDGLTNGDDISDLQNRLQKIPRDLESFFQHIFDGIDEIYREQTAVIFRTTTEADHPLSVVAIANLEKERRAPDYALEAEIRPLSKAEIMATYETIPRRVNARCKDLLEVNIYDDSDLFFKYQVDFLHKTVRDFLKTTHMREMLTSWAPKDFEPKTSLCKALLAQLKSLPMNSQYLSKYEDVFEVIEDLIKNARAIELERGIADTALLDEVDSVMSIHFEEYRTHWTNRMDSGMSHIFGEYGEKDFLAFAVEEPLLLYVQKKLTLQPELALRKRGRPLLDYALRPAPHARMRMFGYESDIDLEMVRLLLDKGADPNQEMRIYGNVTVWSMYLHNLVRRRRRSDRLVPMSGIYEDRNRGPTSNDTSYEVTKLLIERGANPELRMGIRTVIEILYRLFSPSQCEHLNRLLEKNRPSAIWQWLGLTEKGVDWPKEEDN